jgi:simple sugar transport system permease protein
MIATIFTLAFVAQVTRIAVPYAFAALGGSITERSGNIDLALEAKLAFGAFAAAAVGHATGSALAGIAGGVAAGMAVAAVQIGCSQWLAADQVIVGVALNIIALAGTRFLLQALYHEGANSPPAPSFGDAVLGNPLVPAALAAAVIVPLALRRTRWGLRLRAAGDRPDALVAVGVSPRRTRLHAALVGGALAGAGGAQLSLGVGGFSADMSSGRGYIALAMIILGGWRPAAAAAACVGVALTEAIGIQVQIHLHPTSELWRQVADLSSLLPYVVTLVVLAVYRGDRAPPSALGKL